MSTRATWLAWTLAAFSVAMFVASGVLYTLARSALFPVDWVLFLADWALFLAFPIVGALVASRRPENPIGWICLASGLLFMFLAVTDNYSIYGVAQTRLGPLSCGDRHDRQPVAMGASRGAARDLPDPAVPRREAPLKKMASAGIFSGMMIVVLSITEGLAPGPWRTREGCATRSASRRSPGW